MRTRCLYGSTWYEATVRRVVAGVIKTIAKCGRREPAARLRPLRRRASGSMQEVPQKREGEGAAQREKEDDEARSKSMAAAPQRG